MDESLFIFSLVVFFVCIAAVIYCFLSTCLGLQVRQSDFWEAIFTSRTPAHPGHNGRRNIHRFYENGNDMGWGHDHRSSLDNLEMMSTPGGRYQL